MKSKNLLIVLVSIVCIFYLTKFISFSSYQSNIGGEISSNIANWNIKLNGNDITTNQIEEFVITDVAWTNAHAVSDKAAPGSSGTITLNIDASESDVAVEYEITIDDSSISDDQILTLTSVRSNNNITVEGNTCSGIISLSDLESNNIIQINLDVTWINDEDKNDRDSNLDENSSFLKIQFNARQYLGTN